MEVVSCTQRAKSVFAVFVVVRGRDHFTRCFALDAEMSAADVEMSAHAKVLKPAVEPGPQIPNTGEQIAS